MRNNTNFTPPNHVTPAVFRAALRALYSIPVVNNNLNLLILDAPIVTNSPDAHSTPLLGAEEQHIPTE
ncbi:MAG: hypothetical protein LBH67_01790 [Rickettsia sp.]|jgi:hypothetical protein|nr:hypothetical protein [Rickettsia sp.]